VKLSLIQERMGKKEFMMNENDEEDEKPTPIDLSVEVAGGIIRTSLDIFTTSDSDHKFT
jgi:hypothetical protein